MEEEDVPIEAEDDDDGDENLPQWTYELPFTDPMRIQQLVSAYEHDGEAEEAKDADADMLGKRATFASAR